MCPYFPRGLLRLSSREFNLLLGKGTREIDLTLRLAPFKPEKPNPQNGIVPPVLKSENGGKESKSGAAN